MIIYLPFRALLSTFAAYKQKSFPAYRMPLFNRYPLFC